MANYSTLKAAVADVVKTNGNQAITGANLQSVLLSIINSVGGGGYIFKGVATPSTSAGTPDENVFYIGGTGTYANFGTSVVVPPTNIAVFKYNGTWTCEQVTVENGGVFDISAFKAIGGTLATYADLAAALGTGGANVPEGVRKGGMSIKFVQSSDNKYVQFRYMPSDADTAATFTNVANWQGVDDVPTADSNNLVKSGGIKSALNLKAERIFYSLYKSSYIYKNTVYIDSLLIYLQGIVGREIQVKQSFVVSFGFYLVVNRETGAVRTCAQANISNDEDLLLISTGSGFLNTGKLVGDLVAEHWKEAERLKEYSIQDTLVAGAVWSESAQIGEVYQPCDGAQKKYFLSQRFIAINGATDTINSITLSESIPYYLLQYDKDFHFIGNSLPSTNTTKLVDECRYIKICAGNSSDRDYSNIIVSYNVSMREAPTFAYNGKNDFSSSPNILFRTYELTEPFVTDNCEGEYATTSYRGVQSRIFNWGYIFLPKNYSRTGKPSPVIIHCHGTSGVIFNSQNLPYNTKYLEFLANCGYAVIGCSTFTDKYRSLSDDGDFTSPLAHSCYYNLWKYMTEEFNLDKTGAYIFGYSAGGMNTILLTQSKQIPIKAAAVLAGSVDSISNMRILADYCNEFYFSLIGLPNIDLPTGLAGDGVRQHAIDASVKSLIINNKEKFIGGNPFCYNSNIDYWQFFDTYADVVNSTQVLSGNSTLSAIVDSSKIYFNTPIKIWHAVDDSNVPIQMSRWWRKMVLNGGGLCYMREFPAGCGAHYAVGYTGDESNTPMVDYITPFGETINTPVAYAELVDWFKRY